MRSASIRSADSTSTRHAADSLYGSSRAPSPFELGEARRIVLHNPEGGIEMIDLSCGVQDAFEHARRQWDSPTPGPSLAPSRSPSPVSSLRTVRSIADSTARIIPAPPAEEIPETPSLLRRVCVTAMNVTSGVAVLALISTLVWYAYGKIVPRS